MKKIKSKVFLCLCTVLMFFCSATVLVACSTTVTITSIEKTGTSGLVDTYTIFYSDGTTYDFCIKNGENGIDGVDGKDVSIQDIYNLYIEKYDDISYGDFLEKYLNISLQDNSLIISQCLLSSLKVYSEFTVSSTYGYGINQMTIKSLSRSSGSAIIYKIDEDYTYILTNYHVIYSVSANSDCKNGIAYNIYAYLYGSDGEFVESGDKDDNGYPVYDYGKYGVKLEYIGGSIDYDIALLKTSTENLKNINEDIRSVDFAKEYRVGETAIAVGNSEDEGISVSEGIISVDNEFINLAIDNSYRSYRSIRIDTAIYSGNSGGGLFNNLGELIGITNAGDTSDQSINYAIPVNIVKAVADNILDYYDGVNISELHKITLGISVSTDNTRYQYNNETGYGQIIENVIISGILEKSIAEKLLLDSGDMVKSIVINDVEYNIARYFDVGDLILTIREGDRVKVSYERDGITNLTDTYIIEKSDIL